MKPIVFKGSGVALITPMTPEGLIDYDELDRMLEWHIAEGTDAIITCGTTGEASVMTDEEHVEVMARTVKTVAGRIPVVAGCGSNHTSYAAWLTREAAALGVDAFLHVTPYYNKTSQAGLVKHFTSLADISDIPTILYNVPSRTGMTIAPQTYKELSNHPNIVGTKEASGDFSAIAKTISLCGDDLKIYSGNDDQIIPIMSLGGVGVISVLANVAPKYTHEMCYSYLNGNTTNAAKMQLDAIGLCDALFCDINPIPAKEAMNILGYKAGSCRLPLVDMSDDKKAYLKTEMKKFGL